MTCAGYANYCGVGVSKTDYFKWEPFRVSENSAVGFNVNDLKFLIPEPLRARDFAPNNFFALL
jgi:hypothetical protein